MSQPSHQSGVTAVTPPPAVMPYVRHRPMVPGRQPIALIAVHSDPTAKSCPEDMIGQDVYVLKMSEALAKLGWQVDIFTRKTDSAQDSIVQYAEHCRVIRLTAGPESYIHRDELFPHLPDFVEAFQAFQAKAGAHYPLIHTNYWLSGWVGLQLKQVRW